MSHLDPDLLALLALGEDLATPDERRHLDGCAPCRSASDDLARAVEAGRIAGAAQPLESPAPRVWTGIAAELGLPPGLRRTRWARPPRTRPLRCGRRDRAVGGDARW